jgi:hypothetical protein
MAHAKPVHRPLTLATPVEKGADVRALQSSVNKQFKHLKIDRAIGVDGQFGAQTFRAAKQAAVCLGATGAAVRKLKRGTLSEGTQQLIRGRELTTGELVVAKVRAPYRRKLRKRFAVSSGQKAVTAGRKLVGVHEVPAGSNWGAKVEKFIRFTGYSGPVFWCGCFACWVVVKLGGAKISTRIRLGYARYITADALAGANGLTAVPAAQARPGDLVCLWGGQHIEVIAEKPRDGTAICLGGNTSTSGKENNGGAVCLNRRSLSDFDSGIVARPNWR